MENENLKSAHSMRQSTSTAPLNASTLHFRTHIPRQLHKKMLSSYITLLILGFISSVCMETCPEPEDLYPCKCSENYLSKEITVECLGGYDYESNIPLKVLQPALSYLGGKKVLHLTLYNIQDTLSPNLFSGIGIETLTLFFCPMDSLSKDDQPKFLGLEDHLEALQIHDKSTIPSKLNLGHLKKLREIELSGNNFPEIGDHFLNKAPPSLEKLYISQNNITKIGSHAFSRLNNLVELWLEDNRFGRIQRSMFPTAADRLHTLVLDNNELFYLPVDFFSRMPSIDYVSLKGNEIRTLDERTWSPIWQQLDILYVFENKIVCDERLNWITKSQKRPVVAGECSAPKNFKGKDLEEFFESQ